MSRKANRHRKEQLTLCQGICGSLQRHRGPLRLASVLDDVSSGVRGRGHGVAMLAASACRQREGRKRAAVPKVVMEYVYSWSIFHTSFERCTYHLLHGPDPAVPSPTPPSPPRTPRRSPRRRSPTASHASGSALSALLPLAPVAVPPRRPDRPELLHVLVVLLLQQRRGYASNSAIFGPLVSQGGCPAAVTRQRS